MPNRITTFAGQLLHFAASVDIVDDNTFDAVRTLVYLYVQNELSAQYFELVYEEQFEEQPAQLRTFWSSWWRCQPVEAIELVSRSAKTSAGVR